MTAVVDERALMHLNVGDFVAIMTHHMKDGKMHWTLGSVETPPYLRDVEIRLWEKQRMEYYNEDETPENPETAELMKRIAQVKEDLQKSIEQSKDLTQQLRDRRAAIMQQIAEADQYVQDSNAVRNAARDDVESIPDRHWQELKSYRIPPKMVSVVIRAVMLLLSEDEARTWPQMQRVLRDFNFKRRITGYDPAQQLSPERRDYILQECVSKKSFRYDRAMQGSVAVGPIYYWVLAQLDCGEAQSQKDRVNLEKVKRQKELREVLKQISEQQKRITEYQELMDDLDDQLRMCNQHNDSSVSRSRRRSVGGGDRYADSFAAREGKEYLKPAFFTWKPTDRVIIVLRKNIVSNFNGVTTKEREEGYNLSDPQIHQLDNALMHRQQAVDGMNDDDDEAEEDMFRQDENEVSNAARSDEDIMRERQAAEAGAESTTEVKTQLQRKFEGKNWQRVLDRKRDAIEAAFTEESAECLEVPEYYISIDDLTIGSLVVDFTAQHDGRRSGEELQDRVDACGYPKVLSLYEEDDEEGEEEKVEEEGPEHQMKFGGDHWPDIAPAHRQEIEEAFLVDTSAATGAKREDIEVQDIRVEEGEGLTVDYSIADKSRDPEQVQEQVDAYAYPEMWALYQQLAGLDEAGPTHQVRFRGERWADIMEGNEEAIKVAFAEDTAEALGISTRQVRPEEMRYEGGLTVPYTIRGCSLDDDEVDQKAEDYGYPKTWALYDRLVAEAVGADYQKAFDGEHWEAVLHAARPEVSEAFCTDTANAVRSAPGHVDPRSVDTDQDRLLVSYNVGDAQMRADEVREDTREYPYPEVWALYQQVVAEEAEGTTNLSQPFDGVAWQAINDAVPEQVRQAFTDDAAAATGADPQHVFVHDVKTSDKGMTVEYGIAREEGQSAHAVRKAAKESLYPTMWALYEEHKDKGASRGIEDVGERESGILERRFDGDDWDTVVEGCPEELNEAFRKDASRVLDVPMENVRVISTETDGLIVKYQVKNPPGDDEEIQRRIDADDFPEVMALYGARVRRGGDEEEGDHKKKIGNDLDNMPTKSFMGEEWPNVLAKKPDELKRAFQQDTADALGVAPEQVVVKKTGGDEAFEVDYSVMDCPVDAAEAEEVVKDYAYPNVWELYPPRGDPGKYEKTFTGAAWESVVAEREPDVKKAFQCDVANCLNAQEADVDVRSVHATPAGLAVRYNVSNEQCENEQVEEMCASCGYPKTWALYEEEGEKDWVITSHQVGFDGDDWIYVVKDKMPELQQAFVSCTAELFCLRMENVLDAKYSIGSLVVDFRLKHPAELTEDDVNKELNVCPYEPVWDLYGYHPWNPEETTRTTHEVGFEGTGWPFVLENRRAELEACFKRDTAIALETQPEDVVVDSAEYTQHCLLIKTTVTHHVFQDNELMQEQLSRFPYDEVWALYEEDPNEGWTTSSHQVGFDGDDWEYVASASHQPLETAFRACTGEALHLHDEHITNLVMEANEGALIVTFDVKHPGEQSEAEINQRLADCDYMPVWDLYINHPYNPDEVQTTAQEVGFEGDEWDKVLDTQPEQLHEAVVLDTAEALEVTPNDVTNINMNFKDGNLLVVTMDVEHSVLQDADLMKEQLSRCPYERVWALYEDAPLTPMEDTESGIIERRFDGDDWDLVVEGCPEELNEAFRKDASRVLDVPMENVRVISTETDGLIVKYQVKNPPGDDEEIQRRIDADDFPEVMALYGARVRRGGDEEEGKGEEEVNKGRSMPTSDAEDAGAYRKDFPGDNWEECVNNSRPNIAEAFKKDAADALGVAPEDVVVRSIRADEEAMHVGYDVEKAAAKEGAEEAEKDRAAPPSGEEVAAKMENYPYPSVWALYQDETITTAHALSFEARHWGFVVRRRRWELARAMSDDSAEATRLDAENVVDARMEAHEENLAVTLYIQHPRTTSAEEIDQNLTDAPFERVWALYELVAPSSDLVKKFDGARWPEVEEEHGNELRRAFAEDTAKNMHVSRLEVEVLSMVATAKAGLAVTYVVHGSSLQDDEMEAAARRGSYPSVWRLYAGGAAGQHDFEGEGWDDVLAAKHAEVEEAFREDTANAIDVPQDAVEVYQTTADKEGLHVQYGIRPIEGAADDESRAAEADRVQHYDYPRLWNLYEETQGAAGVDGKGDRWSGELRRVFEGDDWDLVLNGFQAEAHDAFQKGVSDAVHVPKSDVVVLGASLGSLITDYKVRNCDYEDDEINAKVADHGFPELMELYKARVRARDEAEGGAAKKRGLEGPTVTTQHQVGFDGEDWPYTLKTNEAAVREAFITDSAEQLDCAPEQIKNVRMMTDTQMLVEFDVEHTEAETEDSVDEHLKNCPYERVWELYGVHPYTDSEKVTTEHDIGFEGEDWDYVVKSDREELERTFKAATGNAITVPASDVNDLQIQKSNDGIVITCQLTHNANRSQEELQEDLQNYPYEEMWALYRTRPYDDSEKVTTSHELTFEGDAWEVVCEMQGEALRRAVVEDTAAALNVENEDVIEVKNTPTATGLLTQVKVRHSPLQDNDLIQEELARYEYEQVWALYESSVESRVLSKNFLGAQWPERMETHATEVASSFRIDSSNMLNLPPRFIEVKGTEATVEKGLTVRYTVLGEWFKEEEIEQRSVAYDYPEVWKCYHEEGLRVPTDYVKSFPGTAWEAVAQTHSDALKKAFKNDTADALRGVKPEEVEVTGVTASAEDLCVTFTAPTGIGEEEKAKADASIVDYPYPGVWELYQDDGNSKGAAVTTLQDCGFEGEDWDYTWEKKQEEVCAVFTRGVAEAIGVQPEDITDVNMEKTHDGIILGARVTHPLSQEYDWIQAALRDHPFEELWLLYETRPYDPNDLVDTEHIILFEGEEWEAVMASKHAEVLEAIRQDTADAFALKEGSVLDIKPSVDAAGLKVLIVVRHSPLQDEELIQEELNKYEYNRVWALYEQHEAASEGHKRFDGTNWAAVLRADDAGVAQAFREDTAAALNVEPVDVEVQAMSAEGESLNVSYKVKTVRAPAAEVESILQTYPYPNVWDHYQNEEDAAEKERAAGVDGKGDRWSGKLRRVFEGDDWDLVLNGFQAEAHDAFQKGVSDAVHVPKSDVVVLGASLGSLITDYKVRNCDYEDDEINAKVADHGFPELMELYKARVRARDEAEGGAGNDKSQVIPVDAEEEAELPAGYARAALSVIFEGELWEHVVRQHLQKLTDTFRADTASAVGAELADIHIREYIVSAESVMVHFSASYHESTNETDLRGKVDQHPYEDMWALYDEVEAELKAQASTVLVKRFDGVDWDLAVEAHPEALEEAFREDTADVLQTSAAHVTVDSVVVGSLIVHFRVIGIDIAVDKITTLVDNYAYPKVWALYISRDNASRRVSAQVSTTGVSRKAEPLMVEEGLQSEDSVTYLRKALADARRERDMYMEQAEKAEEEAQRASQRHK